MRVEAPIQAGPILLNNVELADADGPYLRWMRDPETLGQLESRFQEHTADSLRAFIASMLADPSSLLLAMREHGTGFHVGNIKLGPIDARHSNVSIGLIVAPEFRGRGYAWNAINSVSRYAFQVLRLNRVHAGMYDTNRASLAAFLRAGFTLEGTLKSHWRLDDGRFVDGLLVGRVTDRGDIA